MSYSLSLVLFLSSTVRRTLKSGLTDAEKAALGLMPKSPTLKV